MPYAINGQISQSPIEGGIEITQAQYQEALAGMQAGKVVSIDGGFAVIDPPEPETPEPEPIEPQPITIFSSLDYLSKFTDAEYQAARTGTMRAQRSLDMLIAAQYVDIENDPRVPAALDIMIEDCGMTPERKGELLTPQQAA